MRKPLKFFSLLFLIIMCTSCAAWLDDKTMALLDATCPSTISTGTSYSTDGTDEDATLPWSKNQKSSSENKSDLYLSYSAGFGVGMPIANNLTVESGLLLTGRGNKTSSGSGNTAFKSTLKLTYVDVPILARYQFGDGGFSLFGGFQPGLLVNAKNKTEINGNKDDQNVKDDYKSLNVAGRIGVGYEVNDKLGINIGYEHGLTKISNTDFGFNAKNRALRLGVSYRFSSK